MSAVNWANVAANTASSARHELPVIAKSVTDVREPVAVITVADLLKAAASRTWPGTMTRSQPLHNKVEIECAFRIRAIISSDDLLRMQTLLKLRGEL